MQTSNILKCREANAELCAPDRHVVKLPALSYSVKLESEPKKNNRIEKCRLQTWFYKCMVWYGLTVPHEAKIDMTCDSSHDMLLEIS